MARVLHEMADADLAKLIDDSRKEIRDLRFQFGVARSLQNPSQIRTLRRTVAGALTVLSERKLGKAVQKAPSGKAPKAKAEAKKEVAKESKDKKAKKAKS
jgi:large subunit ribosomal protein L29